MTKQKYKLTRIYIAIALFVLGGAVVWAIVANMRHGDEAPTSDEEVHFMDGGGMPAIKSAAQDRAHAETHAKMQKEQCVEGGTGYYIALAKRWPCPSTE